MTAREDSDLLERICKALYEFDVKQQYHSTVETEGWPEPLEPKKWKTLVTLQNL